MKAVNELLQLSNEASEAAQLEAINKIITARNEAVANLALKENELALANKALVDERAKVLLAENNANAAIANEKKVKAEALVQSHVGTRIADNPATILQFVNLAIADYDGTKTIIEGINLNTKAPDRPEYKRPANAPIISVAEYRMAQ